jgi:hypothetical protein
VPNRDENWQQIQKRLTPQSREEPMTITTDALVVPLRRKQNQWAWLGALAAAALALFVLYPSLQPKPTQSTVDSSLTKGTAAGPVAVTDCRIDVRGKTNEAVNELNYSQGFEVTIGEAVQIFYTCHHDGYLQVWNNGRPAEEYRNLPVVKDRAAGIHRSSDPQGRLAEFPLQAGDSWVFSVVLTDSKIGADVNLLDLQDVPATLGTSKVLWYDTIAVKGKAQ